MGKKSSLEIGGRTLQVSNLDKVMYPGTGFTKGQVIDYYIRASNYILPHLKDRPLTLKRYPDGVNGMHFYEKNAPGHKPEWVEVAKVPRRGREGNIRYVMMNDLPSLVWAANLASLEMHVLLANSRGFIDRHRLSSILIPVSRLMCWIACTRVSWRLEF